MIKTQESVEPWLLTTGPFKPRKIAPLNFLGSSLALNFFKLKYENDISSLEIIFSDTIFFRVSVRNLAVPSAVFNATLPVNPSVTITLELPSGFCYPRCSR